MKHKVVTLTINKMIYSHSTGKTELMVSLDADFLNELLSKGWAAVSQSANY